MTIRNLINTEIDFIANEKVNKICDFYDFKNMCRLRLVIYWRGFQRARIDTINFKTNFKRTKDIV